MEKTISVGYVPSLWIYAAMDRRDTVFLDSSMRNELGRRSYIGIRPWRIHTPEDSDAVEVLNSIGDGTLMGFLSYDYGMDLMGMESVHGGPPWPLFALADFDIIIEDDPEERTLEITCKGRLEDAESQMQQVIRILKKACEPIIPEVPAPIAVEGTSEHSFMDSVEEARRMEAEGSFYVVNLSRRIRVRSDADPFDVFLRLRRASPSPYGAYADLCGIRIASSSMELLLDVSDGSAWTRPIKGTSPRTGTAEEDRRSLEALLSSGKDRSELLMVTDMERNDLNRFCIPGSVEVEAFYSPEEYSTLYHTVSDVTGRVPEGTGIGDMVKAMFPGGSITGAPKRACMEAIDSLEDSRRGLYTGSIGLFSMKRTTMNIAIRTLVESDGVFEFGIGGGITYRSDAGSECSETIQKGKAMMRALGGGDGAR